MSAAANLTATAVVVGDDGVKGVKSSNWTIDSNGVLDSNFSYAGYILDVHNTKSDGGGNGFRIMAGETLGDIAFHVADQDDTFQIMEMEADQGYITLGKTYAQTLTDNGDVYGVDIQHTGEASDFNTQNGVYRIGGDPVMHGTHYQYAASDTESTTTSTTLQVKTTLTTGSLPSGDYRLAYTAEVSNASNGVLTEIEVKLDGVVVALPNMEADNDYLLFGGFVVQTLSGVVTATISHRVQTTGTSKIRRARLELWRVS